MLLAGAAFAQTAPREVHGSHDAYAAPGVALAWGVLRGRTMRPRRRSSFASSSIRARIPWLAVTAIDPFRSRSRQCSAPAQAAGPFDLRIPRAQFADYPRTELRLFDSAAHAQANAPQLVVFYHGVPDTTPEFADAAKLDASLSERIARARAAGGGTPR